MGLIKIIKQHRRIMFDTSPIIYFIERNKIYKKNIDKIFNLVLHDYKYHAFSSVITLIEVLTKPLRDGHNDIVQQYKKFLLDSGNFFLYPIDVMASEKASLLRSQYNLKTPDAIQIAVAIEHQGTLFITNDINLKKIKEIS